MLTPNLSAVRFIDATPGDVLRCSLMFNQGKAEQALVIRASYAGTAAAVVIDAPSFQHPVHFAPAEWRDSCVRANENFVVEVSPGSPILLGNAANAYRPSSLVLVGDQWFITAAEPKGFLGDGGYLNLHTFDLVFALPEGAKSVFPRWTITSKDSGLELYASTKLDRLLEEPALA